MNSLNQQLADIASERTQNEFKRVWSALCYLVDPLIGAICEMLSRATQIIRDMLESENFGVTTSVSVSVS